MNRTSPSLATQRSAESAQARVALRLTAALTELQAKSIDADIDARLRFAHDQALAAARKARTKTAPAPSMFGAAGGAAVLGGGPDDGSSSPWWLRLGSVLPLAVLLAGLFVIDHQYTRAQIEAAAEVDAAILVDDVPPEAYRDQGFVEYLKTARP